jgi:hypothetical protein
MLEIMKQIEIFSLTQHAGDYEQWPQVSELIKSGISTGKYVSGYIMVAPFMLSI